MSSSLSELISETFDDIQEQVSSAYDSLKDNLSEFYVDAYGAITESVDNAVLKLEVINDTLVQTALTSTAQLYNLGTSSDTLDWIINAASGNDTINTNSNKNATVNAGQGDDILNISGSGAVYVNTDDGNDIVTILEEATGITTVDLIGSGNKIISGFRAGFEDNKDIIQINDIISDALSNVEVSLGSSGLVISSGNAQFTFGDISANTTADDTTSALAENSATNIRISDGSSILRTAIAPENKSISLNYTVSSLPMLILGQNSGVNFSYTSDDININLSAGVGTVSGSSFNLNGINKIQAGNGNSTVIGSDENETLIAGNGNTEIWGGSGVDVFIGQGNSDSKTGSTTFHFNTGDGENIISNFNFLTAANNLLSVADKISVNGDVNSAYLSDNDVVVVLDGEDKITVNDAVGKVLEINGLIAKVDENISFDGLANCYIADGGNSLSVDSSLGSVEIWLDNSQDTKFFGDIRTLDASNLSGNTSLVGNDNSNTIIAGNGNSSLWGGASSSNDELIGGQGQNTFFYCNGNGNDIINSNGTNDIVMLSDVTLNDLASGNITDNSVSINFKDGGSLTVNGTTDVTYQLADESQYSANRSTGEWQAK